MSLKNTKLTENKSTDLQNPQSQLIACREAIDSIDQQLLHLINQRALQAKNIGLIKQQLPNNTSFYSPAREADLLRKLGQINQSDKHIIPNEKLLVVFREIISLCLSLEKKQQIAYLGPAGTFTHAAALKHFGQFVDTIALDSINDVFKAVESEQSDYGVVPIENSTEGMVTHTLDQFLNSSLHIVGEIELKVQHCLLGAQPDLSAEQGVGRNIKKIYAHQQALAQCRNWLDLHYPDAERIALSSNAKAAQLVKDLAGEQPESTAIASRASASIYKLQVIAENIQDQPDNSTRFLILGREKIHPSKENKTSVLIATPNKPGALYRLLESFYQANIDLTRIETRPLRGYPWNYMFFIDFKGHITEPHIKQLTENIAKEANLFKHLGSYPISVL